LRSVEQATGQKAWNISRDKPLLALIEPARSIRTPQEPVAAPSATGFFKSWVEGGILDPRGHCLNSSGSCSGCATRGARWSTNWPQSLGSCKNGLPAQPARRRASRSTQGRRQSPAFWPDHSESRCSAFGAKAVILQHGSQGPRMFAKVYASRDHAELYGKNSDFGPRKSQ